MLKTSSDIQKQVDKRLRQSQEASTSSSGKHDFKSKRGSNIDCVVKNKVTLPQDTILGGHNRQRVTYDQLNLTQWVQGFAQNILDEKSRKTKDQMLQYFWQISWLMPLNSLGKMQRLPMRSCYVTWKGELSPGITLTKLTELGHMPKGIHKIQNPGQKPLNKDI